MKPWRITYGDHSWTDTDVTAAHAIAVAEICGDSWEAVSPWNGPRFLAAWLVVLLAAKSGGELDGATAAVYSMSVADLCGALDEPAPLSAVA